MVEKWPHNGLLSSWLSSMDRALCPVIPEVRVTQSSLNFHPLRLFIQLQRIKVMFTFIQISNIFSSVMFMLLFITFSTMVVTI